jgi:hypothetical protein
MDFPIDFWMFYICFINVLFKVITNFKFNKYCFIKGDLRKQICTMRWCLVRQINP